MTSEPQEPIDVRNNPESRSGQRDSHYSVARASDGGAPPREAPASGELPTASEGGTAEGNPVAGVTISKEDEEDAVSGDTGPIGLPNNAGHA